MKSIGACYSACHQMCGLMLASQPCRHIKFKPMGRTSTVLGMEGLIGLILRLGKWNACGKRVFIQKQSMLQRRPLDWILGLGIRVR